MERVPSGGAWKKIMEMGLDGKKPGEGQSLLSLVLGWSDTRLKNVGCWRASLLGGKELSCSPSWGEGSLVGILRSLGVASLVSIAMTPMSTHQCRCPPQSTLPPGHVLSHKVAIKSETTMPRHRKYKRTNSMEWIAKVIKMYTRAPNPVRFSGESYKPLNSRWF